MVAVAVLAQTEHQILVVLAEVGEVQLPKVLTMVPPEQQTRVVRAAMAKAAGMLVLVAVEEQAVLVEMERHLRAVATVLLQVLLVRPLLVAVAVAVAVGHSRELGELVVAETREIQVRQTLVVAEAEQLGPIAEQLVALGL